jgi:hypothetical protein
MTFKTKLITIVLGLMILIGSCVQNSNVSNEIVAWKPQWSYIRLSNSDQSFYFNAKMDSLYITNWSIQKEINILEDDAEPRQIDEKKRFYLDSLTKDSLFNLVWETIKNPVPSNVDVTCYAGRLSLSLTCGGSSFSHEHYAIGDWTVLSPNTKKIYRILSRYCFVSTQ